MLQYQNQCTVELAIIVVWGVYCLQYQKYITKFLLSVIFKSLQYATTKLLILCAQEVYTLQYYWFRRKRLIGIAAEQLGITVIC